MLELFQNNFCLEMDDLVIELKRKVRLVKDMYGKLIDEEYELNQELSNDEMTLYHSMQRWHENSHMSLKEWLHLFNQVKPNLQLEDDDLKFKHNNDEFFVLLEEKLTCTELTERFAISGLFSDEFLDQVRIFFQSMVDEKRDEFDFDFLSGRKSKEALFLQRTFLPTAVFVTYSKKHTGASTSSLFHDCFSIGSGSRSVDLIPEVHGFCPVCSNDSYSMNRKIFSLQVKNEFKICIDDDASFTSADDQDDDTIKSSSKVINKVFNPFILSDSSEDEDVLDLSCGGSKSNTSGQTFRCQYCTKEFSKPKFKETHTVIFHGAKQQRVEFVAEPVDLITSFSAPEVSTPVLPHTGVLHGAKQQRVEFVDEPVDLITSFSAPEVSTSVLPRVLKTKAKPQSEKTGVTRRSKVRKTLCLE